MCQVLQCLTAKSLVKSADHRGRAAHDHPWQVGNWKDLEGYMGYEYDARLSGDFWGDMPKLSLAPAQPVWRCMNGRSPVTWRIKNKARVSSLRTTIIIIGDLVKSSRSIAHSDDLSQRWVCTSGSSNRRKKQQQQQEQQHKAAAGKQQQASSSRQAAAGKQ